MSAIPFIKMGTLLLKQASKPFASQFKKNAHRSETLQGMCIAVGRFWNQGTTRINMMTLGHKVKKSSRCQTRMRLLRAPIYLARALCTLLLSLPSSLNIGEKTLRRKKKTEKEAKAASKCYFRGAVCSYRKEHRDDGSGVAKGEREGRGCAPQ